MNKSYDKAVKDYSIYVYGRIHDLVEELNRYHQKCYINNEKNVDLWKEFKYKKRKRFRFLSVLDYYANVRNKKWEFDIIPIVFNEEYEILHLGVSMLFSDNFSEEYKRGRYNYIELFICNYEKESANQCQSEWTPSLLSRNGPNTGDIMDCLVKVEDLKRIYREEESLRKINAEMVRPSNSSESNDEEDDAERRMVTATMHDGCYHLERKAGKKQTGFSLGEDFSSQDEQFPLYSVRNDPLEEEPKINLSSVGEEVDAHLLLARNVNVIQDNDMSTLRSNLSCDSGSSVRNRFIGSSEKEGLLPPGYYYKKDEESNWKGGSSNREDSSTDGGAAMYGRAGKEREGAYPFSHLGSGVDLHSREMEHTNDADQAAIHKVAYYKNVKRINELEEKTYISSEGGPTKRVINYEYLYRRSESETMYLDALRGRKNPCDEGDSAQGDANELGAPEERPFASTCSVGNGYSRSVHAAVERSEIVLEGSRNGGDSSGGGGDGGGTRIGQTSRCEEANRTGQTNRCDFTRFTKHEQITRVNHNETIQSSDQVHIVEREEYRRDTYTTTESRSSHNILADCNSQEGKGSEAEKRNEFKLGFFSSKGNRTYNEDRVITIRDVNEFVQREYKEVVEEGGNLPSESLEREYYDMLQKTRGVDRSFGCPSVESEGGVAASGTSAAGTSAAGTSVAGSTPPPYMYCAIYDGHNGEKAVNIIQKLLHLHVHTYYINGNGMCNSLKYAFHKMDEHLCRKAINNEEENHSNFSSGSTACVSVIFTHMMYIANIGDSRCVLSKNGRAVVVTVDHRASGNKKEEERIITSGGMLDEEGYLGGCLGVCRGFGSFDKKTREKLKGLVCEPDLFQIKLTDDDEFLIICCDGIFDVMTSQEAVNTVRASLVESSDPTVAAEALCQLAYKRKALDNLSVVVVIFQNPEMKKSAQSAEGASLYAGQAGRVRRRIRFSSLKNLIGP